MVWHEVYKAARRGRIIFEEPGHSVVAAGSLTRGYIYLLEQQTDRSTDLRHIIENADRVQAALNTHQDVTAALDELAPHTDTLSPTFLQTLLGTFLGSLSPAISGEEQIQQIKKKAERAARKAGWIPQPVPMPAAEVPAIPPKAEEFAVAEKANGGEAPLLPSGKPPWNPRIFTAMAFLFSFGASGILAGINWRRLGKPQWMWPTILLSVVGLMGFLVALALLPVLEGLSELVGYGINIGVGVLLTSLQTSAYKGWEATYGESSTKGSGWLIPIVVGIGTIAVVVGLSVCPSLLPADPAIEYYNRGVVYQQQGQLDLAIDEYTQAIALNPQFSEAYYNRGNAYYDKGDLDRAIADFDQAIEFDPQDAEAYYNRGLAYASKGRYDQALSDLSKCIEINARYAGAYYLRGVAYAEVGEQEKAISDMERALELGLDPSTKQDAEELLEALSQ
jgi:tetratricopeptide (TPR) repeat protein